ncbi:MAG TPA: rhodanese-like domain-containing protein [Anaerovoracaceae bacterium]|nr:rhodanese-like domain-containing protein [Anaerovoracaceae bacterium]
MNIKKSLSILLLMVMVISITACASDNNDDVYNKITSEQAKEIIDAEEDIVILDVRTKEEYDEGHIENAILIPNTEINDRIEEEIPDKDTKILVYCRSGNRSSSATRDILELGYTDVYDFGGIINWDYEIVK